MSAKLCLGSNPEKEAGLHNSDEHCRAPIGKSKGTGDKGGDWLMAEPISVRESARLLFRETHALGFRPVAFHDLSSKALIRDESGELLNNTLFGWTNESDRWWEEPLIGLKSPLALAARYESEPFWLNRIGVHGVSNNRHLDSIDFEPFFRLKTRFKSLIAAPAHQPFGRIGLVCFFPIDSSWADLGEKFAVHGHRLALIARRFLRRYAAFDGHANWMPENCKLTKRQLQCLHWASLGKSDREMAEILALSHAAVRYHLSAAIRRLECVNRTQAVFKAGQLGYIGAVR